MSGALCIILLSGLHAAHAATAVGKVELLEGMADVFRDERDIALKMDDPVFQDDESVRELVPRSSSPSWMARRQHSPKTQI